MILGKKSSGEKINKKLHYAFLLLNMCIESSYNLYPSCKEFAKKMNTNHLILYINQAITNINNIHDAGNPYSYYRNIMNYLSIDDINIVKIYNSLFIQKTLYKYYIIIKIPHVM